MLQLGAFIKRFQSDGSCVLAYFLEELLFRICVNKLRWAVHLLCMVEDYTVQKLSLIGTYKDVQTLPHIER